MIDNEFLEFIHVTEKNILALSNFQ